MKKVLFIFCTFYGYEKKIIEALEKNLNYKVYFLNAFEFPSEKYKNIFEKLYNNFFYKIIYKRNYKTEKRKKKIISKIESFGEFDYIFCIRPDIIGENIIRYLKSLNKKMYLHHWDSIKWYREQEKYLNYFTEFSTFDKEESTKYGMKLVPNFYISDLVKKEEEEYEIFTVMSYDYRFEFLEKIAKSLKERGIKYKFLVMTKKDIKSDYITIIKEGISIDETYKYINKSKTILEIGHDIKGKEQGGLSFRAIETLGCKKKLVTTYSMIKEYDFYCEDNIYIISHENYEIPKDFLASQYTDIDSEIYESYSDKSWIKKIFCKEI